MHNFQDLNNFFAFDWTNLSEIKKEKISRKIHHKYGFNISDADVKSIFKCLVARDIELPMPYIKIEDEDAVDGLFPVKVYDKSTGYCHIEYQHITRSSRKAYFVYGYIPLKKQYQMLKARNSNLLAFDKYDAVMYDYNDAVEMCKKYATWKLLRYVCFGWSSSEEDSSESKKNFLKQIENRDWTKIGTVTFKKSDFMENPVQFPDYHSRIPDWRLKEVIEKYQLSTKTDQLFIDWIVSGCKGSIKKETAVKLTEKNFKIIHSAIEFQELTRGNVVDFYHGFPENSFNKLKQGSVFSCNNTDTKYVVIKIGIQDHERVIAYAKTGTSIDGDGFINEKDILFGIDKESVEECWDALFYINRLHRKKKILKNIKILKV